MKKLLLLISTVIHRAYFFYACDQSNASVKTSLAGAANLKSKETVSIERGKYMAWHVMACMDCHCKRDFSKFSGPVVPGTDGMGGERFGPEFGLPGNIYSRNITPAAIGKWTDEEIIRLNNL
jgi:hypothetical protein